MAEQLRDAEQQLELSEQAMAWLSDQNEELKDQLQKDQGHAPGSGGGLEPEPEPAAGRDGSAGEVSMAQEELRQKVAALSEEVSGERRDRARAEGAAKEAKKLAKATVQKAVGDAAETVAIMCLDAGLPLSGTTIKEALALLQDQSKDEPTTAATSTCTATTTPGVVSLRAWLEGKPAAIAERALTALRAELTDRAAAHEVALAAMTDQLRVEAERARQLERKVFEQQLDYSPS